MENKKSNRLWRIILLLIILVLAILVYYFNFKDSQLRVINPPVVNQVVKQERLVVSGSGNEPGWYIKLYGREVYEKTAKTDLVLDYGDTSWAGSLALTYQASYVDNFQYLGNLQQIINNELSSSTKKVTVSFKKEVCLDPAGKEHSYKVILNFNAEKFYDGCADLLP